MRAKKLTFLMAFTYMVSYITRINYGAVIAEMVIAENILKSTLSLAVTGSFITYGTGQLVSGFLGDRLQPKKLVFSGLFVTCLMNFLIPLCPSPYAMLVVWCINGFAQSFMWPPIVKIMTSAMTNDEYQKGIVVVSWGSSAGTILVYLLAPVLISLSGWRLVFIFSAVCAIIMMFAWQKFCPEINATVKMSKINTLSQGETFKLFSPIMIMLMLAIIMHGVLRDGATTWMPSYISETYSVKSEISILTSVVMPIFSIFAFNVTQKIYKQTKNPLTLSGIIFIFGFLSAFALCLTTGRLVSLSVLFTALLVGSMHGVNLLLLCMILPYFKKYGNVSFISGALNACTYIGSALSTYGIAWIAEKSGWSAILIIWTFLALAGGIICLAISRAFNNKFMNK
ncbi:MAG: MFS transporter [Clostridia bacterium]|nr:MFS transporter [Clostridia bacterium]